MDCVNTLFAKNEKFTRKSMALVTKLGLGLELLPADQKLCQNAAGTCHIIEKNHIPHLHYVCADLHLHDCP